jgi:hypothetical protein
MPSRAQRRASAALNPAPAPTINARSPFAIADPPETDAVQPMPQNRRGDADGDRYRAKASRDTRF